MSSTSSPGYGGVPARQPATAGGTAPPRPRASRAGRSHLGRSLKLVLLAAVAAAVVLAGWRVLRTPKAAPVRYQTRALDRGSVVAKVTANGALSALVTVNVGSQVSGRIQTLRADFGSHVNEGDVVATIDPALFRAASAQASANLRAAEAAVLRARAQVANAEKQFARAAALRREGLVTQADYETNQASLDVARADRELAQSNVSQARAARDQAELNLKYTTIVSPIDGIVISRNVDVGQTVAATLQAPTLFTIAQDLTRMQVDTNVAEADVGRIHAGMDATFTVDAYPERVFRGRLRQIRDNAQTIQNVVTYDAVVDVDNTERLLKPGMTASVSFIYASESAALRIPNAALRFRPDSATLTAMLDGRPIAPVDANERTLWLLRGGKAVPAAIRPGISDGTYTALAAGQVKAGELAIVEAQNDGARRAP